MKSDTEESELTSAIRKTISCASGNDKLIAILKKLQVHFPS